MLAFLFLVTNRSLFFIAFLEGSNGIYKKIKKEPELYASGESGEAISVIENIEEIVVKELHCDDSSSPETKSEVLTRASSRKKMKKEPELCASRKAGEVISVSKKFLENFIKDLYNCGDSTSNTNLDEEEDEDDDRLECEICEKPFKRKCDLTVHKRTHFNERPYKCTKCGNIFPRLHDLKLDLKEHILMSSKTNAKYVKRKLP